MRIVFLDQDWYIPSSLAILWALLSIVALVLWCILRGGDDA